MSNENDGAQKSRAAQGPRIVAELGRAETPEETAARKAENSRAHRANQTTRNLVLALLASLAVVLCTVLFVVRPDNAKPTTVDYRSVAVQAQSGISTPLAAPELPRGWRANSAQIEEGQGKSQTWYVGLLTPKQQFIAIDEGVDATDVWFGSLLGTVHSTGHITVSGIHWTVYDQRNAANPGNFGYSLTTTIGAARYVLHGSADDGEFRELAAAIARQLSHARAK